jgi:signal transduction histidine kinase
MSEHVRDRVAAALTVVVLVLGVGALAFGRSDPGVRLSPSNDLVYLTEVHDRSVARQLGMQPGMVAVSLNGVELIDLPTYVYPNDAPDGYDPETGEAIEPAGLEPSRATPVPIGLDAVQRLLEAPLVELTVIEPSDLDRYAPDAVPVMSLYDDGRLGVAEAAFSVLIGVGLLAASVWLLTQPGGPAGLRSLAVPLGLAAAAPFLLRPLESTGSPPLVGVFGALLPLTMLPLAAALLERIVDPALRQAAGWVAAGCAAGGVVAGAAMSMAEPGSATGMAWWGLVAAVPLAPGLAAARPFPAAPVAAGNATGASGRLLQSTELALVGATPAVALATDSPPFLLPMALWIGAILFAGRVTIRPLARLATRATLQRDLVVAATEAERARVAADIHDDALQELTMLVRKLDAGGDAENAAVARQIADRLRAICGDLRLPILDDLGVGPALDWLVVRIERLAGGEVRLERSDGTRPPPDVELAIFRVAQEALANAVKHGRPPIVVRYHSTAAGASLSIDDAGPGIEPTAGAVAEREGRFGLLNMQQRAEGIGAILDVRRWPGGGTHVALEWRPR